MYRWAGSIAAEANKEWKHCQVQTKRRHRDWPSPTDRRKYKGWRPTRPRWHRRPAPGTTGLLRRSKTHRSVSSTLLFSPDPLISVSTSQPVFASCMLSLRVERIACCYYEYAVPLFTLLCRPWTGKPLNTLGWWHERQCIDLEPRKHCMHAKSGRHGTPRTPSRSTTGLFFRPASSWYERWLV